MKVPDHRLLTSHSCLSKSLQPGWITKTRRRWVLVDDRRTADGYRWQGMAHFLPQQPPGTRL